MNCMKSFLEMQVARHRIGQNVESLGVALGKLLPQSQHPVILQTPVQVSLKISLDLHPLHEPLPDHCIQHSAIIHPSPGVSLLPVTFPVFCCPDTCIFPFPSLIPPIHDVNFTRDHHLTLFTVTYQRAGQCLAHDEH